MTTSALRAAFLATILAILGFSASANTLLVGRVVAVADGDTITVLDPNNSQHKVRLLGIDAPEKGQAFGQRSKQNMSDLVFGKDVRVEFEKRDRYGRILGKVLMDGVDVGLQQVRDGMAWHFKRYQSTQAPEDRKLYAEAEQAAREAGIGLWIDPARVAPWEYRRR